MLCVGTALHLLADSNGANSFCDVNTGQEAERPPQPQDVVAEVSSKALAAVNHRSRWKLSWRRQSKSSEKTCDVSKKVLLL